VDAYTFTKQAEKVKQTLSAYQKAGGNCFLGQETSADDGIHATRNLNNVTSVLRNTKKLYGAIKNKRRGMLTFLRDNMLLTLKHCWSISNCELFDHLPYSSDLALSDYHLFMYLKN
jgi:hypothetical protein